MTRPIGSKNKKEPEYTICPKCGLRFKKQGLGTHNREKHHTLYRMEIQTGFNQNQSENSETVKETLPHPKISKSNSHEAIKKGGDDISLSNNETINNVESKKNLFTTNDLYILQGRLYEVVVKYDDDIDFVANMKLGKELDAVKQDFYRRFNTSEDHLKRNHQELFYEAKNLEEEMRYRAKFIPYAKLKYSDE